MNAASVKALSFIPAFFALASAFAGVYKVGSPDGKIRAEIRDGGSLALTVKIDGAAVMDGCVIGMDTDKGSIGNGAKALSVGKSSNDSEIENVIGIKSRMRDNYNQLDINFGKYGLIVRVYDECVAYRFVSNFGEGPMTVLGETLILPVDDGDEVIAHMVAGDKSSHEEYYKKGPASMLKEAHSATLPFLFKKNGLTVALMESDVFGYPGLRVVAKDGKICGYGAKYPKSYGDDGMSVTVAETEDFLAKTDASRAFPWRIFTVAREDKDLTVNDAVYKLARPAQSDFSWVKPGLSVWDWWHNYYIEGVDFEGGVNEQTYKSLIDFAAKRKIPYIIFDGGMLDSTGLPNDRAILEGRTTYDVGALIKYAESKNVKVMLWFLGKHLMGDSAAKCLDKVRDWGAAGIKVDFIDRDDQVVIDFYERIARLAAERRLIVDFHGCSKPTGLQRTYPNAINYEAVRGNEYNKFDKSINPEHNVSLVFTRLLQGPMDYTPGATRNVWTHEFVTVDRTPMSMGTRSHQMAMFILYYAPFQVLCDSPSLYSREKRILDFVSSVPTAWDDSVAIDGKFPEYVVVARRSGKNWYVGGMTNWTGRELELDLPFLDRGKKYRAEIIRDTVNSSKTFTDFKYEAFDFQPGAKLKVKMTPGGGFALKLSEN